MLNLEVLAYLDAVIDYCEAHEDGENDWQMVHRLLNAVRGAAEYYPELKGLHEHVQPYIEERIQRLMEEEDGPDPDPDRHA